MIEKVDSWKASDGKIHQFEADAMKAEARLEFVKWYDKMYDQLLSCSGDTIYGYDLADWILSNKDEVENLISEYE